MLVKISFWTRKLIVVRYQSDGSTPGAHTIIIPSHLTASADLPSFSASSILAPVIPTTGKSQRKGRNSTLLRAVMDKAEVAKALSERDPL